MYLVKRLAKGPVAHTERTTKIWNVERLIQIRERQILRLFDEIAARPALYRGRKGLCVLHRFIPKP